MKKFLLILSFILAVNTLSADVLVLNQGETTQKKVFTTQKTNEKLITATQKEEISTRKSKSTTQKPLTTTQNLDTFECFPESRKKSEENCTKIWNKWRKVVNLRPKRWRKVARLSKNNVRKVVKPSPLDIE